MKFNNLSIYEKIGCVVLIFVCIVLLYSVMGYSEGRFKNTGFEIENKFAIIMGNEGRGVSSEIKNMADEKIYINMNQNCESLNVAVATSIILYELNK